MKKDSPLLTEARFEEFLEKLMLPRLEVIEDEIKEMRGDLNEMRGEIAENKKEILDIQEHVYPFIEETQNDLIYLQSIKKVMLTNSHFAPF
ncbi:MAG: hypothetical protein ABIE14_01710 [Patescibacteria group bacterium]